MNYKLTLATACFILLSLNSFSQSIPDIQVAALEDFQLDTINNNIAELRGLFGAKNANFKASDFLPNDSITHTSRSLPTQDSGYGSGGVANMFDKFTLKPTSANFSNETGNISEDLNSGKLNVSIPLFEMEYFDFKLPVILNNRYPQKVRAAFGEPVFYTGSRVGGDWTLSVDQYKVSRQINGVKDEDPNKGYFSTASQSRINNPASIESGDISSGQKGNWDSAIDIYHFSTPTVSGSFIIDLPNNQVKYLTSGNYFITFTKTSTEITSFTVTDEKGTQYLFGGDVSAIEISQSKTNITQFGFDLGPKVKYILKVGDAQIQGNTVHNYVYDYNGYSNRLNFYPYGTPSIPAPLATALPADQLLSTVWNNHSLNGYTDQVVYLGTDENNQYSYVAILYDGYEGNRAVQFPTIIDDADLRELPVNTGWYLKQITLVNGKKINFSYNNTWDAYSTFGVNQTQVQEGSQDINLNMFGGSVEINGGYYACMPQFFSYTEYPINESKTETRHFIKSPKLFQINDEDMISKLEIIDGQTGDDYRPYLCPPSSYPNPPAGTTTSPVIMPMLIDKIKLTRNGRELVAQLDNYSDIKTYTNPTTQVVTRIPWEDESFLNGVSINNEKEYKISSLDFGHLESITYPTGAVKAFESDITSIAEYFYYSSGPNPILLHDRVVTKVTTSSEDNTTEETYQYSGKNLREGRFHMYKSYKPSELSCVAKADLNSTIPIFAGSWTKNSLSFNNVQKFVNNELRISSTLLPYQNINYPGQLSNSLTIRGGAMPSNFPNQNGPTTLVEEKVDIPQSVAQFKTDANTNQPVEIQSTNFIYNWIDGTIPFPNIHLTNIEAGPLEGTNGVTRRAFSYYYLPVGVDSYYVKQTDTEKYDDGSQSQQITEYNFFKLFSSAGTNVKTLIKSVTHDSEGNEWRTEIKPVRTNLTYNPDNPLYQAMISKNMNLPLEQLNYRNNELVSASAIDYTLQAVNGGTSIPVIKSEKEAVTNDTQIANYTPATQNFTQFVFDSRQTDKVVYDLYNSDGRPIQFHTKDGTYTTVVWGYKGQKPVAKIENAKWADFTSAMATIMSPSAFFNLSSNVVGTCNGQCEEESLINVFNMLRASRPTWMITSYTFDYDTGVNSITDPKGYTTYYEYDNLLRLTKIKNDNGETLETYKYHYKEE